MIQDTIRGLRDLADDLELTWEAGVRKLGLFTHDLAALRPPAPPPTALPDPPPIYTGPVIVAPPPTQPVDEFPAVPRVWSTCFGNEADEKSGEWKEFAYGWSPPCSPGSGKTTVGAAVPFKVEKGDAVSVRVNGGLWITIPVIDKGPWNTSDPYLVTEDRPAAESGKDTRGRKTNKAGLDLTPAAWALLLGKSAEDCWKNPPSAYLDVRFVRAASAPPARVIQDAIRAAALALPDPFPYEPDTEEGNLGCANVVSRALIEAGVISSIELSVAGLATRLKKLGWKQTGEPYADGDVIVWGPRAGGTHGHIGILIIENGSVMTVQNSSSQKKVVHLPLAGYDRPLVEVLRSPKGA